ncbi:GNAT family N-acetyltransferase [Labrenzia sp. DG1229]|uniref:GNAT family N-acetyltransferase n=1 Tax=Labrenzia sp. DG1229 TaxID=681847 RepID=UPI00069252B8|nr:GNAT family N-acetyltransferase [Labrenzia sp. DG1229]
MKTDATGASATEAGFFDPLSKNVPVEAWQALCDEAVDPNPFFNPSFLQPFLTNMSVRNIRLLALKEKSTGRWLMAAPIRRCPAGLVLPVATVWTTEYSPLGTPLMSPQVGDDDVKTFVNVAAGRAGILAIPFLPMASGVAMRLTNLENMKVATTSRFERASHASGGEGEKQLEDAFKGKRRKEMRRLLRRLEDHGTVNLSSVTGTGTLECFEQFLELEASGWKGREESALGSNPQTSDFSREVIASCAHSDSIRVDELRAGDNLIASLVSFVDGGCVFTWKIAFDEGYARYSPGAQLVLHTFRENLAQSGFRYADSLAVPGHSMIEPLWRGRLEFGTLLLASQPLGDLKNNLCAADMAFERKLRQVARTVRAKLKS